MSSRSSLPQSYSALPFKEIRCHHVPQSSNEVTPTVILELYRPAKYNAFTVTIVNEMLQAFDLFAIDDRVKCIVVTGHGKMFCAGADLQTSFVRGEEKAQDHRDGGGRVALAIHQCRKPVIAAINGAAVGVGITMCLPMTIRIAWKDAKVGFVHARRGIIMEACSSFFLPRLIGMSKALHLVTTAAVYTASHPLVNPLFSETVDTPDAVLPRALEIAQEIVRNTSMVSFALQKEMMYRDTGTAEGQHLLDSRIIYDLFSSADQQEGVKAFLEKRPVEFHGTLNDDAPSYYPWWASIDTGNRPVARPGIQTKPKL